MPDIYEIAATEAEIPEDRREAMIALARKSTQSELASGLAEAMHGAFIFGDPAILDEFVGTRWHADRDAS